MGSEPLHATILNDLEEGWRDQPNDEGNAAIAIAATVLQTGRADLPFLVPRTGFRRDALKLGRARLLDNGVIKGKPTAAVVCATEEELEDGVWWALLGAIGKGWVERVEAG